MTGARRTSVLGLDWRNCRDLPDDEIGGLRQIPVVPGRLHAQQFTHEFVDVDVLSLVINAASCHHRLRKVRP